MQNNTWNCWPETSFGEADSERGRCWFHVTNLSISFSCSQRGAKTTSANAPSKRLHSFLLPLIIVPEHIGGAPGRPSRIFLRHHFAQFVPFFDSRVRNAVKFCCFSSLICFISRLVASVSPSRFRNESWNCKLDSSHNLFFFRTCRLRNDYFFEKYCCSSCSVLKPNAERNRVRVTNKTQKCKKWNAHIDFSYADSEEPTISIPNSVEAKGTKNKVYKSSYRV